MKNIRTFIVIDLKKLWTGFQEKLVLQQMKQQASRDVSEFRQLPV
jgi:hypothetical protein